ncbi:MAG: adenylyltransferase [Micromonosporaceae bacterium]|nr:adenylyltransferase [Micromonosporaceae bacterium]
MSLYHVGNSRGQEQAAYMRRLDAAGVCIFCPEHLAADPDQDIVHRTPHWTVTPNRFPYVDTLLHLMLVPDEHVTDLLDLSPAAQLDFWAVLGWVREHHRLTYYSLGARNGDCRHTGGTIAHVHVHVIVGDPDGAGVRFKMSATSR